MIIQLIAAAACAVFLVVDAPVAAAPSREELAARLTGAEPAESLAYVVEHAETLPPDVLFLAAHAALAAGRLEDSGTLFYAGQLRIHFERACFPPVETGGDDPFLLYGALSHQCGAAINPAIMAAPKEFAAALVRLEAWKPRAGATYDPGYAYRDRLSASKAREAAAPHRKEFMARMGDLSKLLLMPEYSAAFRTLQGINAGGAAPADDAARLAAEKTLRRIERETKLRGVFAE